ncbi:MAG: thiamine phosphate synthase [SAR86 cluster bacterium]|uniref:Thiamine-phosphate synthase n=1 Tax=SAR86 cluster bacterium TaxID=2030880 RepID=A0A2A5AZD6_9GAMM|nr:MAG: thiamine phosphate synthase [SAR86 cluster bacterium]
MNLSGVYAITDDLLLPGPLLFSATEAALEGGVSLIQYRSKEGSPAQRLKNAQKLATLCRKYETPLIINDDISLCESSQAQGVHLGHTDGSVKSARQQLGCEAIIGVTCHSSIEEALAAEKNGASYVAFGRFFPSKSKPQAPLANLEILNQARVALTIPIVAIGGINAENSSHVLLAGADMLAVIHGIFGRHDVLKHSKALVDICAAHSSLNS